MATGMAFHASGGAADFLGVRRGRCGRPEIVHDAGADARTILRLVGPPPAEDQLRLLLQRAIGQRRVLSALLAELSARAINVEVVRV